MTDDPKRLIDDGPDELRAMLGAARAEVPDAARIAGLALKLGAIVGGGAAGGASGGGGAAAAAATKTAAVGASKGLAAGLVAKVTTAVIVTTVAATSAVYVVRETRAREPLATGIVASTEGQGPTPTPTPIPTPDPIPTLTPTAAPIPTAPAVPSASTTADNEVKLLDDALAAVRTSPDRALLICNEHARRYPNGEFAQEREVIAIEALVKLGRQREAEQRARRFEARYPGSSHQRRIETLIGGG
jgi:hypothetical protein